MSQPSVQRGAEVAGWFNTHAKRVTESRVDAFRQALPDARVYACSTFEEAERHADELVKSPPRILFCGGGDGTVVALLNSLRKRGATKFPLIGLFKLGTGNGWPSAVGAHRYERELRRLPTLSLTPASKHFQLCEVEGKLCQFTGVGWDATLLNDYRINLENRQAQILAGGMAARLSKGLGGYLYSLFRLTVPGEIQRAREGRTISSSRTSANRRSPSMHTNRRCWSPLRSPSSTKARCPSAPRASSRTGVRSSWPSPTRWRCRAE